MKTKALAAESKTARTRRSPGGTVYFILQETPAREVFVAGDFNGWIPTASPLSETRDGHWLAEIGLPPGRHEYLFVVDGDWMPDPAAEWVTNAFGGVNSVVTVSAFSCV